MDEKKMLEVFEKTISKRDCKTCEFYAECKDENGSSVEGEDLCTAAAAMALEAFKNAVHHTARAVRCPSCGDGFIFNRVCNVCGQVVLI